MGYRCPTTGCLDRQAIRIKDNDRLSTKYPQGTNLKLTYLCPNWKQILGKMPAKEEWRQFVFEANCWGQVTYGVRFRLQLCECLPWTIASFHILCSKTSSNLHITPTSLLRRLSWVVFRTVIDQTLLMISFFLWNWSVVPKTVTNDTGKAKENMEKLRKHQFIHFCCLTWKFREQHTFLFLFF